MLYDLFICHATEDKEAVVRPLATMLRERHIAVWYDEFELGLGDSIRLAIDRGLSLSRFGLVVLSPAFFAKRWPQYELDGLAERDMASEEKVILPVWHQLSKEQVLVYSPSLANRRAAISSEGLERIVDQIVAVVRPTGSPLVEAWSEAAKWGLHPPSISDPYWLHVVQASNRVPAYGAVVPEESAWGRWSFPLPGASNDPEEWGARLAWTALQLKWVDAADQQQISVITDPKEVWSFIDAHPGLFEMCANVPDLAAEYAPQLTIPEFSGRLTQSFDDALDRSVAQAARTARTSPTHGTALTVDRKPPSCDDQWAIRHPSFGGYEPASVANAYFAGSMFGPSVSPWEHADHLAWLLSDASRWMPRRIHSVLLEGMASWGVWTWTEYRESGAANWRHQGALSDALHESVEGTVFRWTSAARVDLLGRLEETIANLLLPESPDELQSRFASAGIAERWIAEEKSRRRNHVEWHAIE